MYSFFLSLVNPKGRKTWPNRVITLSEKIGYDDCMIGKPQHPWYIALEGGIAEHPFNVKVKGYDNHFKGWKRAYREKYGEEYSPQKYFHPSK